MSRTKKVLVGIAAGLFLLAGTAGGYLVWRLRPAVEHEAPLPQVALTDLRTGQPYDLAGRLGEVVLLDFWAST